VYSDDSKENHIVLINNNSKTRKLVFHKNFKTKNQELDIFNFTSYDDTLDDLYNKHDKLSIDVIFHVFSKILEGDKGDNVPSI
jgi:hypothetical protein